MRQWLKSVGISNSSRRIGLLQQTDDVYPVVALTQKGLELLER